MRRKKKASNSTKKRLNLFTTLFLLLIISGASLFLAQQINNRQVINSNAQTTCSTPGGCGGNCNQTQNSGCGYGGCRYWEYCADENGDGVPSCYDTTNLGTKLPDYNRACGSEKANKTSGGSSSVPTSTSIPQTNKPSNTPAPQTNKPTSTPVPIQNSVCSNPQGCGGNCNSNQNSGCGYGGCRFWEYCADENGDGVSSCYDTTNNGKLEPNFSKACGYNKTSSALPSPTTIPVAQTTAIPTLTPKPTTISQNNPTDTPIPTTIPPTQKPTESQGAPPVTIANGYYDLSKLCIPLQINGSPADKMDIVVIPLNFTKAERTSIFYSLAATAVNSFNSTNLPNDVKRKMNWYILDVDHKDFNQALFTQYKTTAENSKEQDVLSFGIAANYCGRDRFMIIWKRENSGGMSYLGVGGLLGYKSIAQGLLVFAHEWGHAGGSVTDEYKYTTPRNINGSPNCTTVGAPNTPNVDPCPEKYPGAPSTNVCNSSAENEAYKTPCPKWDCNLIDCTDRAKQLLANAGCYPRCENAGAFRASANSIMSTLSDKGSNLYSGPSLVNIIEKAFARYK